jgi:hypothetical protein
MKQTAVWYYLTTTRTESWNLNLLQLYRSHQRLRMYFITITSFRNRLHTVGILSLCCRPGTSFLEKCLDQPMEDNDPDTHIYSNTTNFLASSCVADFLHGCNFVPTFTIKKKATCNRLLQSNRTGKIHTPKIETNEYKHRRTVPKHSWGKP